MATVHSVRDNVEHGADFTVRKCWQHTTAIDHNGVLWLLVLDMAATETTTLYLYKYNDDAGVYSNPANASINVRDDNKASTASMVFDKEKKKLLIVYEWTTGGNTKQIQYIEYDTTADSFSTAITIDENAYVQFPDICIDNEGTRHIVWSHSGVLNYYYTYGDGQNFGYNIVLTTASNGSGGISIICSYDNILTIILSTNTTTFQSGLYEMPVGGWITTATTVVMDPIVAVTDKIGDLHLVGKYTSSGDLGYRHYDRSAGQWDAAEQVAASAGYDAASGFGICQRWDYTNNRADLYAFYEDNSNVVNYKKRTTSWGSAVVVDNTLTDAVMLNIYREELPSEVDQAFLMCWYEDNDGATPYPVEAWHSGTILVTAPSTGGYYDLGRIRSSTIFGINLDNGGWEKLIQNQPIIAIIDGVETVDFTTEKLSNDAGDALVFSDGYDIEEYDNRHFDDEDKQIVCILQSDYNDGGDPDRVKTIEKIVAEYESASNIVIYLSNEKGVIKRIGLTKAQSGEEIRVNFRGKRFNITVYEASTSDFKFYGIRLYLSTSEMLI